MLPRLNMKALTAKDIKEKFQKIMKKALNKPPSRFFIYTETEQGQKRLKNLTTLYSRLYKNKTKEELIEIIALNRLENSYNKSFRSKAGKAKNQPYQKYLEMARRAYAEALNNRASMYKTITLKDFHKILNEKYPKIYWNNNLIESTKEKKVNKKVVVNLKQIYTKIVSEHKHYISMMSASRHT